MMLKDNEKFYAFVFLILSILGLVFLASTFDRGTSTDIVVQGKLRIIDSSVAGLLTIAGMCAQALFKISTSEKADIAQQTANAIQNGPPLETKITNPSTEPVPTTDTQPVDNSDESLPEYARG